MRATDFQKLLPLQIVKLNKALSLKDKINFDIKANTSTDRNITILVYDVSDFGVCLMRMVRHP